MTKTRPDGPALHSANEVDADQLDTFLRRAFGDAKADFLGRHGDWWHRGAHNRLVLTVGPDIAGYCALMPTVCQVGDEEIEALWWIDLVIAPEFRGQGLQSHFDREVRSRDRMLLGAPNELAAAIHRKHGWGVREDLAVSMLPLRPRRVAAVQRARGARGSLLRAAAGVLSPAAAVGRWWWKRYRPRQARRLPAFDAGLLADIARRSRRPGQIETRRDEDHLRWRYGDFPWREQLRFYVSGPRDAPSWALVARQVPPQGSPPTRPNRDAGVLRILELYGDPAQKAALRDIVALALRDAAVDDLTQVTVLASPAVRRRLAPLGFVLRARSRFCWLASEPRLMNLVAQAEPAWGLGDSDNDDLR